MSKLKLGVIGMSQGNGHPFSWSAIFNGYELSAMEKCGFPVIPEYLEKQDFPNDFLTDYASVDGVWTQDIDLSKSIAKASKISNVYESIERLVENTDAVLLARDDAETHREMLKPIVEKGKAVFVDKPFALNLREAEKMFELEQFESQIFTCSALRYASEFQSNKLRFNPNDILEVEAFTPKYWKTYAMHILEPSFNILNDWSAIRKHKLSLEGEQSELHLIKESGRSFKFRSTGNKASQIVLRFKTTNDMQELIFEDSFNAFKSSLSKFIEQVHSGKRMIPKEQSLHLVECLELGQA